MAERLVKVLNRRTTDGKMSMWGTLHLNAEGRSIAGWLCDSWTEAGVSASEVLLPRLYWLNKEDDQLYTAFIEIPVVGVATIARGPVDKTIEPRREAFIRAMLAQWENEFLSSNEVRLS